ncbi:D-alanyl-D-alanine carboxypeptidase family protein [Halobacillus sp. A5]|uniref:D-alanyl-D-alanine carboxypeptidase family protein n=1 Tax=Halobacillus sp. A5 TaxID=2880263 RepID=UPI0020A62054|nr:D-alanyl-D-alanine carboxypeptidase family protein [Halobacillus sp. A5]MCP3025810.1 D-alanyl-D-alanine carboxypeptidase [Halobacillus sp. A5]
MIYTILFVLVFTLFGRSAVVYSEPESTLFVSAEHAVLIDAESGRVLFEKDSYSSSLIASTTKIMTAIIAVESGMMEEEVVVSERAIRTEGSSIYLTKGEKIKLKDLVYGLMLRSGNDSAIAIAEHVGGSAEGFTQMMNEKAAWLGMQASNFENPHGLDGENHVSSAYDLALLMAYSMKNETFREVTGSVSYKSENRTYSWQNKNKLLTSLYEHTTGGKTGFTKRAGRTLVSSAEKDGMELIAVTLNAPSDWSDHERMYEWGFNNFETYKLQEEGYTEANGNLYYLPKDILFPLTESEKNQIKAVFKPNAEGETYKGVRTYHLNENLVAESQVLAKRPPQPWLDSSLSFFKRMVGVELWST